MMKPIDVVVEHPELGRIQVKAFCRTDALLQASLVWKRPWEDLLRCKTMAKKEDLLRLKQAAG